MDFCSLLPIPYPHSYPGLGMLIGASIGYFLLFTPFDERLKDTFGANGRIRGYASCSVFGILGLLVGQVVQFLVVGLCKGW